MDNVREAQDLQIDRINQTIQNRVFEVGETILAKTKKRLGNKLIPCVEGKVVADLGTTVLIKGRVVHRDDLR